MAFDIESLGGGGIAGTFIGILTALGLKGRVNRLEDKKLDRSVFEAVHKGIEDKFVILVDGQKRIFERIDSINDYLRNEVSKRSS